MTGSNTDYYLTPHHLGVDEVYTAEELRRARLAVAHHARDAGDCALLLEALGLGLGLDSTEAGGSR